MVDHKNWKKLQILVDKIQASEGTGFIPAWRLHCSIVMAVVVVAAVVGFVAAVVVAVVNIALEVDKLERQDFVHLFYREFYNIILFIVIVAFTPRALNHPEIVKKRS